MAVTDADQLTEIVWRVVEDIGLSSGLWTLAEIAGYFNQRQNRFNRDTKLLLAVEPIAGVHGTAVYDLPQDWIATQRVTWKGTDGIVRPVDKSDRFATYAGMPSVNAPTVPIGYDDQAAGTLKIELAPAPTTDGTIGLLYASLCEVLNFNPAAPDIFNVPDDFVPYVLYGALADMLSKDGRGQDLSRAQYCEDRYQEGVALAAILLQGFL